jgi:uncharacterized membrane protein YdbT with pleckstrin-like domain
MAYPRHLLSPDERLVLRARPHWVFLGWPLVAFVATTSLWLIVVTAWPRVPSGVDYVLGGLVALCLSWLVGRTARRVTTWVVLTSERLSQCSGVFARHVFEIRLDRVGELSYHQSLPQRALGTGTVMVSVCDDRGVLVLRCVRRPAAVQRAITSQAAALVRSRRGADVTAPDIAPLVDTPPAGLAAIRTTSAHPRSTGRGSSTSLPLH